MALVVQEMSELKSPFSTSFHRNVVVQVQSPVDAGNDVDSTTSLHTVVVYCCGKCGTDQDSEGDNVPILLTKFKQPLSNLNDSRMCHAVVRSGAQNPKPSQLLPKPPTKVVFAMWDDPST